MSTFLGPLDSGNRVPPRQQTRLAAFLLSAHGALARHLAFALMMPVKPAWYAELNAQLHRETEIVSLLLHATSWLPDPQLLFLAPKWEVAWLIKHVQGAADQAQRSLIDLAALGHAVHALRPAALLPEAVLLDDTFVQALRRIEFESGRLIQAQILFLKSPDLVPFRGAVSRAVDRRHIQVRQLWHDMLTSVGVSCDSST